MKSRLVTLVFAISLFASSFLLFALEPLITKMVLPLLGGSASVWNTALLFFQTLLLAGYLYAHFLSRIPSRYIQVAFHGGLLLIAAIFLPPSIDPITASEFGLHPITWTLLTFGKSIGLPFLVLAATAPLLQHWYSHTSQVDANDPYFLYAASNAGSLLALLAYPTLIEPGLGLLMQSDLWSNAYAVAALMIITSGAFIIRSMQTDGLVIPNSNITSTSTSTSTPSHLPQSQNLTWPTRLRWLLWSFIPSAMLLAVSLHISVDIAAAPFLWVIPLAIYLLTFVIAFMRKPVIKLPLVHRLHAWSIIGVVIYFSAPDFWLILGLHVGVLFFTGLVYHMALAKNRPSVEHLTEFYLWISVGGWLGGVFSGLIAPALFNSLLEYPLLIILAALLRPTAKSNVTLFDVLLPIVLAAYYLLPRYVTWLNPGYLGAIGILIYYTFLVLALDKFNQHSLRFGLSITVLIVSSYIIESDTNSVGQWRSFYGVYEVAETVDNKVRLLSHGTTIHGAQAIDANYATLPLTYYNHEGPLGQVVTELRSANKLDNIAAVGLGVGTIACLFKDHEQLTIFEIDPLIEQIASDNKMFTYLERCNKAGTRIVVKDGRLGISELPDRSQDLIIMDAFTSDAIPSHLLTVEALQTYVKKLKTDGLLLIHISNKYIELEPVVSSIARKLQLVALRQSYTPTPRESDRGGYESDWMLITQQPEYLQSIARNPAWQSVTPTVSDKVWTDDYSNLFGSLIWGKLLWSRDDL